MDTIYDRNKENWTKIERAGFSSLAEMARRMTSPSVMDDALGYRSATSKWTCGKGMPSPDAERRARAWVSGTRTTPANGQNGQNGHTVQPDKADAISGTVYLVACPPGMAPKVEKVLGFLGCDVTEV